MQARRRRIVDLVLIVLGAAIAGAAALAGGIGGDRERVLRTWVSAEVQRDGSANVVEVIDYDFGALARDKHGIYRDVPGLTPDAPVTVSSDGAPDDLDRQYTTTSAGPGIRIRIGDPGRTVSGRHSYRIDYPLPGVVSDDRLSWDAVGTEWTVPIERAEIHVVAAHELVDPRCFQGTAGSTVTCDVEQVEPGHLVAHVSGLASGEGVSIESRTGQALAAAPAPPRPPAEGLEDQGTGLLPPAGAATAGVLVAAVPVAFAIRRAGRERVAAGGAADAAYVRPAPGSAPGAAPSTSGAPGAPWPAPPGDSEVLMDQGDLEALATIEFAPPEWLSPAQGGIVLTESVKPEHKTAWLIQAAIDGAVDLHEEGGRRVRLTRTGPGTPEEARVLDMAFDGRTEVELGHYDSRFANAWGALQGELQAWRSSSGLWDLRGNIRRVGVLVLGVAGLLGGLGLSTLGGFLANGRGDVWLPLAALGGLLAGAGFAAAFMSWELRVRTPAGSAAWLRVESFRRFLASSEADHAEEAARRGVLREYTAWALALGEIDRWSRAVAASTTIPQEAGLAYVHVAPILVSSAMSAATAPSSSSGGGGGSVGGGAGGGGGGSW